MFKLAMKYLYAVLLTNSKYTSTIYWWKNYVGICVRAISGRFQSLQAHVKQKVPECTSTNCMIHIEALATKDLTMCKRPLSQRFIWKEAFKIKTFSALYKEMAADFLISHQSGYQVANFYNVLRDEIAHFLEEKKCLFRNHLCTMRLSFFVDTFDKFNYLNL